MTIVSRYRAGRRKTEIDSPNGSSRVPLVSAPQDSLPQLLDGVHGELSETSDSKQIQAAVDRLFRELNQLRDSSPADTWREMIGVARNHPIRDLLHQDPFTSRAFHKPRGYAGDAVMMDYIYGWEEDWPRPSASPLGDAIFDYTTTAPASAGVRERRCHIAELLDQVSRERADARVLAIAAGHLREAALAVSVRRRGIRKFVASDADPRSLEEIQRAYGRFGIETQLANVRRMLTRRPALGTFDLVYSTGLYDYLTDSVARRLTANLFQSLRPGGRLVIANFLPGIRDVGYMEMFMDWFLIYRTRGEMLALADEIPEAEVDEVRLRAEPNDNVVIMHVSRR